MLARDSRRPDSGRTRRGDLVPTDVRDPALAHITEPPPLTWIAGLLALGFLLLALLLILMPWQQSALGTGRVIAFAPADRQQVVEAAVDGRVAEWLVSEGDVVEAGQPLVQILDNDPNLVARLEAQRLAAEDEIAALEAQLTSYTAKLRATQANREVVTAEYQSKIAELHQKRIGDLASLETAERNLTRTETLAAEGINSERSLELAKLKATSSQAKLRARDAEISATRRAQEKAEAEADTKISSTEAELGSTRAKLASVRRKFLDLQVDVSRQDSQLVRAPRAGTVLRLYGGPGGGQTKKGDPLVTIVPTTASRAVELWVDGNDMPFITPGSPVRLVFEGWPALQVAGLRGASRGTFGGEVGFVDATDDGSGQFRVVILPDSEEPWPEGQLLRQGVQAKGWLLLGEVSLGYEIWRQMNGFPPRVKVDKGDSPWLPSAKKPRAPTDLKQK